jgi:hypothetical protein
MPAETAHSPLVLQPGEALIAIGPPCGSVKEQLQSIAAPSSAAAVKPSFTWNSFSAANDS